MFTDKIEARDFTKMAKEYQDLLIRVLRIQADCEIGGPHLYVNRWMLGASTADEQWKVAKTAMEEIDHFRKMNRLLQELGFDATDRLFVPKSEGYGAAFPGAIGTLVKPGGLFIGATLNRTPQSYALAIIGAEYIMRWLPRGTHDWRRFLRPSEFVLGLRRAGLAPTRLKGLGYRLTTGDWALSDDLSVNYLMMAVKK